MILYPIEKSFFMNTLTLKIDDPIAVPTAKAIIQNSGLIAFPTDTVYGLAADVFNPAAIQRIYVAKGRSGVKAIPILIGAFDQLLPLIHKLDERALRVADAFWPGPLTLVLQKSDIIPPELTHYPTVGVRMPNHPFTQSLLKETGPLAATSANLSGGPNPVDPRQVLDQLGNQVNLVLDGGPTSGPIASTVIDLSGPEIKILRPGPVSLQDINKLFNQL